MFVDVLSIMAGILCGGAFYCAIRAIHPAWRSSRSASELDRLAYESSAQKWISESGGLVTVAATTTGGAHWLEESLNLVNGAGLLVCAAGGIYLVISSMRRMDEIVEQAREIRAERERRAYAAALAAIVRAEDARRYGGTRACDAATEAAYTAAEAAANTDDGDGDTETAIAAALADPSNQPSVDFHGWLAERGLVTPPSPPIKEVATAPSAPSPDAA